MAALFKGPFISTDIERARHVSWQTKQYSFIQCLLTYKYLSLYNRADTNRHGPCTASIRGKNILSVRFMSVRVCGYLTSSMNRASKSCRRLLFCLPDGIAQRIFFSFLQWTTKLYSCLISVSL